MAVTLPESVLARYERFSLYNSPYPAHDGGRAIDLYPGTLESGRTTDAPSPVSGTVLETRTVRAPSKPYAPEHDHLVVLEVEGSSGITDSSGIENSSRSDGTADAGSVDESDELVARILHVDPAVEAGDRIAAGESLGTLIRSGFFAPWVDNHLHVGFRRPDQNPVRASGSLPLEIGAGVDITPLEWDGTGTVVETGETYAILDRPPHPNPGAAFAGIRADGGGVLDGGLPHYDGGGILEAGGAARGPSSVESRPASPNGSTTVGDATRLNDGVEEIVALNGDRLGVASGRTIAWDDVAVTVDGERITGISLFCARDAAFGVKLVCPDRSFAVGQRVRVRVSARD
ncbi:hypothetical protein HALLA_06415 [Halostagnicola larsenii XH-48]|uniref:Peptidase M23 domain-containing protein n=1 Tax=Halostagnicola larsenii XH-48 TaxID=797299 RepID=W0JIH0_9EURY|nr:hypothetical protein [Halostagnicola larsenii]AHF98530.1 hypothetical protein HALLA_06415 [Halostagnicola larsenii XH-48]